MTRPAVVLVIAVLASWIGGVTWLILDGAEAAKKTAEISRVENQRACEAIGAAPGYQTVRVGKTFAERWVCVLEDGTLKVIPRISHE